MFHHRAEGGQWERKRNVGRLRRWWFKQQKAISSASVILPTQSKSYYHTCCPPSSAPLAPPRWPNNWRVQSWLPLPPGCIRVQCSASPKQHCFVASMGLRPQELLFPSSLTGLKEALSAWQLHEKRGVKHNASFKEYYWSETQVCFGDSFTNVQKMMAKCVFVAPVGVKSLDDICLGLWSLFSLK